MAFTLVTTCLPMSAGVSAVTGTGDNYLFTFGGTWAQGDTYTVVFTDQASGVQTQIGAGQATGTVPTFCLTFQNKVYFLSGSSTYFSALDSATTFNNPFATGNGFVTLTNWFSTPETLNAMAVYQGRLAFFSRSTTQIWTVNANPSLWQQNQVLQNIGTPAPLSVQSYGDLDVYFLADSGVRSLRVRDSSLNAYVDDIGSPVDQLIQDQLATLTAAELATCSAVVEPSSNRYMLFVPNHNATPNAGQYYVLSYFKSSKVAAWSTYQPTYNNAGVQTYFTPQNHVVFQGQVWTRDASALYCYNAINPTHDNCVATVVSPYFDMKTPVTRKLAKCVDMVAQGDFTTSLSDPCSWQLSISVDPISGVYNPVVKAGFNPNTAAKSVNPTNPAIQATVDSSSWPFSDRGTHFSFSAVSSGTGQAVFSEIIYSFDQQGEKP